MNLLYSEYRERLSRQAALWRADEGADVTSDPQWTAPLGLLVVSLRLDANFRAGNMTPSVQIGQSGSLPSDARTAMILLADAQATLQRALSCLVALRSPTVWVADCPCDSCGATGVSRSSPCGRCNGIGLRQELTP